MRKVLKSSFLIFLSFFIFTKAAYAYLEVKPNYVNLGEVRRDIELKKYITLVNRGEKEIKIVGIVNKCGLNFVIEQKKLKKDSITEGILNFFSSTALGDFKEDIIIAYQEDNEIIKETKLTVKWKTKADIYSEITITPKKFDFGRVTINKPIPFELKVTNKGTLQGEITTVSRDVGVSFVPSFTVNSGQTVTINGKIIPTEYGKTVKTLKLEIKDFTSPVQEIEFIYEASADVLSASLIEIGEFEKENDIYKIPVTVTAGEQNLHLVSIETPWGEKITVSENTPFHVFKNGKKGFYLLLDENKFQIFKKSYFYFTIGVKKD